MERDQRLLTATAAAESTTATADSVGFAIG
jgi:hypothetical protein